MVSEDAAVWREALVDQLRSEGLFRTPQVEAAFRAVPRHLFVPGVPLEEAYRDQSIPTKHLNGEAVSSSSQPAIMAIMLEQLALQPGQRVLEIGAGTGYNAALMAHLVGEAGQIVTVDIDEDIAVAAREHLAAAGFDRVQVVCGEGGLGYAAAAPYDRIILTVGAWDILPAWPEQLKPGGRLVLPLSIKGGVQASVAFERADDQLVSRSIVGCGFMMLRGVFAAPDIRVALGSEPGLAVIVDHSGLVDAGGLYQSIRGDYRDQPTSVQINSGQELWGGLSLWLALHEPGFCWLEAVDAAAEHGIVPELFSVAALKKFSSTIGLLDGANICVLMRTPDDSSKLSVRSFGSADSAALARRLIAQVVAWAAARRPLAEALQVRVYPVENAPIFAATQTVIDKRWTRLVLDWQSAR